MLSEVSFSGQSSLPHVLFPLPKSTHYPPLRLLPQSAKHVCLAHSGELFHNKCHPVVLSALLGISHCRRCQLISQWWRQFRSRQSTEDCSSCRIGKIGRRFNGSWVSVISQTSLIICHLLSQVVTHLQYNSVLLEFDWTTTGRANF